MNIGLEKKHISYENGDNPFVNAKVIVQPLERGYGITLGVALRRIMLSSMLGSSFVGLKIPGVLHEFTTIPGTATEVTRMILNLKKVRLEIEGDENELKVIRFSKKKKGIYTAADLEVPNGVKILTPEQELINVLGDQPVEIELYAKKSRGFVLGGNHEEFSELPDVIQVDGKFSPVELVGYETENVRVGQNTSFEKLTLTVTTDGSLEGKEAVLIAAKILSTLSGFFEGMSPLVDELDIVKEKQEEEKNRVLDLSIDDLDLSVRSYNCLKRSDRLYVKDIVKLTRIELENINQLGKKSVKEIIKKIKELGLDLQGE